MEVIIKHKKKDSWAGVIKYKNCYDYMAPALTRSGNLHTGISTEEAAEFEKKLNLGEGTLAPFSPFWKTFTIKITNKELILNTDNPWDDLKYRFLKNYHRVANGVGDLKPLADFILINRESEAIEANALNKRKRDAVKEFDKMSLEDMRKCLRLYGFKSDTISNELVEQKMFEFVEKDPVKFFNKWVDNKTKNTEFLIEAAIAKNIVRKSRNVYYYGTDVIGNSLEDAVAYLDNKEHQDLKLAIMNETESKR